MMTSYVHKIIVAWLQPSSPFSKQPYEWGKVCVHTVRNMYVYSSILYVHNTLGKHEK